MQQLSKSTEGSFQHGEEPKLQPSKVIKDMNNWFISDTHFFHKRILDFKDHDGQLIRGSKFSSVEEMNETIRDNWNSLIKKSDNVFHLGDVFFGAKNVFIPFWKTLYGNKHLVFGNHDDIRFFIQNDLVQKAKIQKTFREHRILATHIPVHTSSLEDGHFRYNVHGHLHEKTIDDKRFINVCVELSNYQPVHLDDILQKIS